MSAAVRDEPSNGAQVDGSPPPAPRYPASAVLSRSDASRVEAGMSSSRSEIVHGLADEFLERYRQGERPTLKEYTDRHPELADEICEVFPAMALMERIALVDES